MRDNKYTKKRREPFQIQTANSDNGYLKYRRRLQGEGGQTETINIARKILDCTKNRTARMRISRGKNKYEFNVSI